MAKIIYLYELRSKKKSKNDFVKDFFRLINNAVFGKAMENVKKNRDIKLIKTKGRRNYLVLEPTYHFTKFFTENVLAIKMKKTQVYIYKPVSLVSSVLELSEKLMYKFWYFWYDYVKPIYRLFYYEFNRSLTKGTGYSIN